MKGLVQVTNEMDEELKRDRAVGAVERGVRQPLLVVQDSLHRAVPPPIVSTACENAGLPWTIAVPVVAHGVEWDLNVVPERRLAVINAILIGPNGNVGKACVRE